MADPTSPYRIAVPRRLPLILSGVIVALLVAHVWSQTLIRTGGEDPWESHPYAEMFDVDNEQSIPTWYSSMALLVAGTLVLALARVKQREKDRDRLPWHILGVGFCLMSFDEVAGIHEAINTVVVVDWEIPGAVVAGLIGLYFLRFLFRLPARTRNRFIVAGTVFLGGALGVEHFAGAPYIPDYSYESLQWVYWTALEEGLEMFGVVLFMRAVLDYMRSEKPGRGETVVDIAV